MTFTLHTVQGSDHFASKSVWDRLEHTPRPDGWMDACFCVSVTVQRSIGGVVIMIAQQVCKLGEEDVTYGQPQRLNKALKQYRHLCGLQL